MSLALPTIFTVLAAIAFFTLERVRPGRELPNSRGWYGRAVLVNLGKMVLTLYGALIFFVVFVLGPVTWVARIPVKRFFRYVREPFMIAFSTTSSDAGPLAAADRHCPLREFRNIQPIVRAGSSRPRSSTHG